jgi:flagellar hook-length control protein FliK
MNPIPLSLQTGAPASTAQPAPATTDAAAAPEFLLMLGQLAGTAAAPASTAAQCARTSSSDPAGSPQDAAPSPDIIAIFALTLPVTPADPEPFVASAAARVQSLGEGALQATLLEDRVGPDRVAADDASGVRLEGLQLGASGTDPAQGLRGSSAATDAASSRPVQPPVGSAAWADEIGARLTMMAEQGRHTASLRLSPEHLGPLEIHIEMQDDQATVWFGAAHADTRAAIETALPRLRELFASQGLALHDSGVFHEPPREQPAAPETSLRARGQGTSASDLDIAAIASRVQLGLVDAYA